jgi:REP element-mobilizing transposase RayT
MSQGDVTWRLTFPVGVLYLLFKMARVKRAQLSLPIPKPKTWGGRRAGAGRPRKDGTRNKGVPHLLRSVLKPRFPVHVTWRINRRVWSLRTGRFLSVLQSVMYAGAKEDFRVVHYAFEKDHIHLIVEASDRVALARGMQGLGIRLARAINALMGRRGRVMSDRYHAGILRNPTMVRNARRYLLTNAYRHYLEPLPDPYASQRPIVRAHTWLLRHQA